MGRPVENVPDIEVDPNKIGRSKHEKEFLKDMFQYQSAPDVFEGNDSVARDSNVSDYNTGNKMHDSTVKKDLMGLPEAAEFEICQMPPEKEELDGSNQIVKVNNQPNQHDSQGTGIIVKDEDSDLEPENLEDSRDNEPNENVLFNQKNFLREMQGYQQAGVEDYDSARKLTFGVDKKKPHVVEYNPKVLPGYKHSKSVYQKSQKIQDEEKE